MDEEDDNVYGGQFEILINLHINFHKEDELFPPPHILMQNKEKFLIFVS